MVIRHGGLTAAERIKKAAEVCKQECSPYCPYWTEDECRTLILTDCAEAIAERDERIAIMQESMEALEKQVADSWPTPHAQWLVYKSGNANCSACGYEIFSGRERTPYCPRCGCVMEEVSE